MMRSDRTLKGLIASGQDDAIAIAAHGAPPLTYAALERARRQRRRVAEPPRRRPRRSRRDRPAERPRDGDRVSCGRGRRDFRAAQPRLSPGRIRVLPQRSQRQGADRGSGQRFARDCARRKSSASRSSRSRPSRSRRRRRSGFRARPWAPRRGPAPPSPTTSRSSCTLRAPPRGRRSCRWRRPISGPRPAISRLRLELSERDRALNVMPLFHIHGLIAGLAAPLSRGGACSARRGSMRSSSSPTWRRRSPPGTRRCRPCIRRS